MKTKRMKLAAATFGAAALVGMGAFTVALSGHGTGTLVSDPEATLGSTTTSSTPPSEPETSMAVPEVTAETPDGFGP